MQQNMMGHNIIITEPSKSLRALGRNALKGKWMPVILAVAVWQLCLQVPPVILNALFGTRLELFDSYATYSYDMAIYSDIYNSLPAFSTLASLYVLLVTGAFFLGISLYFLALFRRQQVGITDVFLGFENFGKALGLMLFQGLFIFLWALLFIVPGIIAAIRYSQAFFILADAPDKGIRQCMDESKMMMKGNKSKYFCLGISFLGWILLSALPAGIIESIATIIYMPAFVRALIIVIGSLFMVPVTAYMYSTMAGFYEILAGHLIKETEPAPVVQNIAAEDAVSVAGEPVESGTSSNSESVDVARVLGGSDEKKNEAEDNDDNFPKEV